MQRSKSITLCAKIRPQNPIAYRSLQSPDKSCAKHADHIADLARSSSSRKALANLTGTAWPSVMQRFPPAPVDLALGYMFAKIRLSHHNKGMSFVARQPYGHRRANWEATITALTLGISFGKRCTQKQIRVQLKTYFLTTTL